MINWFAIEFDDIITLAILASSHGWGIHEMLQRFNQLSDKERAVIERILGTHDETTIQAVIID